MKMVLCALLAACPPVAPIISATPPVTSATPAATPATPSVSWITPVPPVSPSPTATPWDQCATDLRQGIEEQLTRRPDGAVEPPNTVVYQGGGGQIVEVVEVHPESCGVLRAFLPTRCDELGWLCVWARPGRDSHLWGTTIQNKWLNVQASPAYPYKSIWNNRERGFCVKKTLTATPRCFAPGYADDDITKDEKIGAWRYVHLKVA
ncbi:hypothetical protein [Acrocarpospora catenulata]|uniref:hypothetical protein n=1 Tax=Acrocarpospora catenulata TaxID=2836182 RepID=UPI001BDB02A7|nr:hypothetical protein [Acrocarpospora catenulata]